MFSMSDLSGEQIEAIKSWVAEGAQMAEVQKRLRDDFGFNVTYMDTRFLSLDLELEFQVEEEEGADEVGGEDSQSPLVSEEAPLPSVPAEGGVVATLDQIARPGAMVSGTVTFSDGMKGIWMIDEMGRPTVDPDQPGYTPTKDDLIDFQGQLQKILDGHV